MHFKLPPNACKGDTIAKQGRDLQALASRQNRIMRDLDTLDKHPLPGLYSLKQTIIRFNLLVELDIVVRDTRAWLDRLIRHDLAQGREVLPPEVLDQLRQEQLESRICA